MTREEEINIIITHLRTKLFKDAEQTRYPYLVANDIVIVGKQIEIYQDELKLIKK